MFQSFNRSGHASSSRNAVSSFTQSKQHVPLSGAIPGLLALFLVALVFAGLAAASAQANVALSPEQDHAQLPPHVIAGTVPVTNTNDSGGGSLRATLIAANAGDTIQFRLVANAGIGLTSTEALAGLIFVNDHVNDGLVAHWKFDETGSATALDFLGANPAVLTAIAKQTTTNLAPLSVPNPAALSLNGTNAYAQIITPSAALAVPPAYFSVAGWVRRSSIGSYDAIYDSGTETNKWWVFIADTNGNDRLGFANRGVAPELYGTVSITDINWHHIAVVKNGNGSNNLTFYVDGAASGTVTATNVLTPGGSARIGVLLDGSLSAFFGGNIDDLRIYNRALSAAEVGRLAQGQGCVKDGSSWATAYRELQCALSTASSGQEIWVAGGTYRPGTSSGVSFNLVNGVNLLGGFTGSETLASQRPTFDPNAVLTNLSGDILRDDIPATFSNYTDNSQGVVIAGSGVNATLDGLAIRQGNNTIGGCLQIQNGTLGLTLNNVVVSGCSASGDGGAIHSQTPLTLTHVTLSGNRSVSGSGGGLFSSGAVTMNGGVFQANSANHGGGGLAQISGSLIIANMLFAGNAADISYGGAALYLSSPGNAQILETTIASPTVGNGSAIYVATGTVGITDTIVASYSIGISNTAGTVFENYNLLFGNTISKTGSIGGGANDVSGGPKFVNPAVDDYHLQIGSAAIDHGADAGVTTDIDGQARPIGTGFDIGYDEFPIIKVYLPLVLKSF